jgi:hypothetical protein
MLPLSEWITDDRLAINFILLEIPLNEISSMDFLSHGSWDFGSVPRVNASVFS